MLVAAFGKISWNSSKRTYVYMYAFPHHIHDLFELDLCHISCGVWWWWWWWSYGGRISDGFRGHTYVQNVHVRII